MVNILSLKLIITPYNIIKKVSKLHGLSGCANLILFYVFIN